MYALGGAQASRLPLHLVISWSFLLDSCRTLFLTLESLGGAERRGEGRRDAGGQALGPHSPAEAHSRLFKGHLLLLQLLGQHLYLSKGKLQLLLFLGQEDLGLGVGSFLLLQEQQQLPHHPKPSWIS